MPHRSHESGQMLVIATLIALVLFIAFPVLVMVNQHSARHQIGAQQGDHAESTALSGLSYAVQQLTPIWTPTGALAGNFSGTDCNSSDPVSSAAGDRFQFSCSWSAADPFAVRVVVKSLVGTTSQNAATRTIDALLTRRTVGTKLPDGSTASAALMMANTPESSAANPITVHWGPIVCLSSATLPPWTLYGSMNMTTGPQGSVRGFPRKFSLGGITGDGASPGDDFYRSPDWTASAITSDGKEYWAFIPEIFPPMLDEAAYRLRSRFNDTGAQASGDVLGTAVGPDEGGHYSIGNGTIVFNASFQPAVNTISFIDGNAEFNDFAVDLGTGAIIVNGNLTLGDVHAFGVSPMSLSVPSLAEREYPLGDQSWPCAAHQGQTCASDSAEAAGLFNGTGKVHFRGFLWVKGTLIVKDGWHLAGVVVVGDPSRQSGRLRLISNGALNLAYAQEVNRTILTTRTELQAEVVRRVAAQ